MLQVNLFSVQYLYRRLQMNNPLWQSVKMTVLRYNYRKDHFLVRVQLSVVIMYQNLTFP